MSKIDTGHSSFVNAFKTHNKFTGNTSTHHMVLFYAVECGLKALVCSSQYGARPRSISEVALENGTSATTHRLNDLIRHLRLPASVGKCPDVKINSGTGGVSIQHGDIHQAWRYGTRLDTTSEASAVLWLKKMVTLLQSKV